MENEWYKEEGMKIKYCRMQFSNGRFKTIKCCKDLSFDECFNRSVVRVHCTDGRIYIFNWNLVQEFKLWEEEEKPNPKDPDSPLYFVTVGNPVEMLVDDEWIHGKIVEGYGFKDGIITIETEDGLHYFCGQDRKDLIRPYKEEKDEKPKSRRKKVSTETSGDQGDRSGDSETPNETTVPHEDDDA